MRRRLSLFLPLLLAAAVAGPAAASEPHRQSSSSGPYLRMQALTANVTRANGRLGVMTADVGIDVPDEALRARTQQLLPRLRAEFVGLMQRSASGLRPGEPPNPDLLSRQFQTTVDRAVGRQGARVLLGTVLVN